ncbi:MAG: PKD domain-containing protein [Flavobacteriales bacterium]|nr:PKD domain-containing protein [Flavobacteriales bacterium]
MKTRYLFLIVASVLCLQLSAHKVPSLEFIENNGQWEQQVEYKAPLWNGAIFLESNQLTYSFYHPDDWAKTHDYSQMSKAEQAAFSMRRHSWRMSFEGAMVPQLSGSEKQTHYYNYFIGNDAEKWSSHTGVFHAVNYTALYPGIDMRAYDNSNASFKYDFIVHPTGDPSAILLNYFGLDAMTLVDGRIILSTSVGEFIENKPYAFQIIKGKMVEVVCNYILNGSKVSFEFPFGYDENLDLVIDPELIASTLSGSTVTNYGHTATFDIEGNIYTGCISFGVGYPATDGAVQEDYSSGGWAVDVGLSKLDPEGTTLYWASYLGGSGGDYPHSLFANDFGELYVYGSTDSNNFPVTPDAYDTSLNGGADIVIGHFSEDGTDLIGCTYIGGSGEDGRNQSGTNYGDTYRGEIILDSNGDPMVASFSTSTNFPTTAGAYQSANNGGQDAVIFRFNQTLSNLEASTYLGSDSDDSGFGLRQTATGDIYLAGMAGDDNFPVTIGCYQSNFLGDADAWGTQMDGFVALLNQNLTSLIASTYFGTVDQDLIFFLDLDNDENVFIFGQGGADIPIVGAVYNNPGSLQFVSRLTADLTTLTLSTQIGTGGTGWGGFDFVPIAFLVDHCNNVYISGHGCYGEVPLTADALYGVGEGGFYLAVFNEDMVNLEYGTMYTQGHVDGGTSRFDKNGTVYQGVCSGGGFATTADAWSNTQSSWDIGVFKIDFDVSGVNSAITGSDVNGCAPFEVEFSNFSTGDVFLWDFGDGATSTEYAPSHIYTEPGLYNVSLIASDSLSCNIADTSYFPISISTSVDYFPSFTYSTDCATLGIECTNTTGYDFLDYVWDMGDGTIIEEENVEHIYAATGTYTITLTAIDNGCQSDSTITEEITIFDEVVAIIGNDDVVACAPAEIEFENNSGGVTFTWDFGDGSPLVAGTNVSHLYNEPGIFNVTLYAAGNTDCPGADTAYSVVEIIEQQIIEALFSLNQIGACEEMTIEAINQSTGQGLDYLWDFGDGETATEENPTHWYNEPGTYVITLTISAEACDLEDEYQLPVVVLDELDLQLAPDIPICYYEDDITLQAYDLGAGVEYLWSNGETTSAIVVDEPGEYTVEVGWNQCIGHDTVTVFMMPEYYKEMTVEFCEGVTTLLTVPYQGSDNYTWCNGETGSVITVNEGADYCFHYIDSTGCIQEGVIHALMQDYQATVWIPNAFTPNADGINDVFLPVGLDVEEYEMAVFNRWGDLIFETIDIAQPWDGSNKYGDYYVPNGIYPYRISYRGECAAETVNEVGHVVIIR